MKTLFHFACLTLVVLFLGCGPGVDSSAPVEVSPAETIQENLQVVVDGGSLGSAEETVRSNIEKLKATDAAKGEELMKDLDELTGLTGDGAKKKAEEMISKLGGAPASGESPARTE